MKVMATFCTFCPVEKQVGFSLRSMSNQEKKLSVMKNFYCCHVKAACWVLLLICHLWKSEPKNDSRVGIILPACWVMEWLCFIIYKGQLISKCLFDVFNFSLKMNNKIRVYYFDTSCQLVFLRFLGEIEETQKTFRK